MMRIGHRGSASFENTIKGFIDALEHGVGGIEFDVRLSRDGIPVIMHDITIDRTSEGVGRVNRYDLDNLKTFNIKNSEEKIPSLQEVLYFMKGKNATMFIELKEKDIEEKVLSLLNEYDAEKNSVVISFDKSIVERVKLLDPVLRTGLIHMLPFNAIASAKRINADYLISCARFASSGFVRKAHDNSLAVVVWTVNSIRGIDKMDKIRVDGIMSDFPQLFRKT